MSGVATGDLVDAVLGVRAGDRIDVVRRARPEARTQTQRAYEALFEPVATSTAEVPLAERHAVAAFVLGLHAMPGPVTTLGDVYVSGLAAHAPGLSPEIARQVARAQRPGPYGAYREPGLAAESTFGPVFAVDSDGRAVLGPRLAAAIEHAELLVLRPRESSPEALDALLAAGWSTTGIVTLSQLVAFLAFQIRLVHGLGVLASSPTDDRTQEDDA